jgi:hypothetical protein
MQKALAAQEVKTESFSKDTLLALSGLKDLIFTSERAMRDQAEVIFSNTCSLVYSERDALGNEVVELRRAVKAVTAQIPAGFQEINAKIDSAIAKLKDQILDNERGIKDRAEVIFNDTSSDLRSENDTLKKQITDIEHAVEAVSSQIPPGFQEIGFKIDGLGRSLSDIKTAAKDGRAPRININVPKQEPSQKTWGLFNMERH